MHHYSWQGRDTLAGLTDRRAEMPRGTQGLTGAI